MDNIMLCIGDSLTFGYGVPKNKCWLTLLDESSNIKVINRGINGDTTPSMLNRLYEDLILYKPNMVFIMGGTNDLLCGRKVSNIIENLEDMILDCKNLNCKIFIGIPPIIIKEMAENLFMPSQLYDYCNNNLSTLRESLITLCNKQNIRFIDFYTLSKNNLANDIFIDGIHLNYKGNKLMKEEALRVINYFS